MIIQVNDRDVVIVSDETLVAGSVAEYTVQFRFSPAWDGYAKTAVFKTEAGLVKETLLTQDQAQIPWEVLTLPQHLQIGVYGVKGSRVRPTLWTLPKCVQPGAEQGDPVLQPETTPWAAAIAQINAALASSTATASAEALAELALLKSALGAFFTQLRTTVQQLAYTVQNHNGAATVAALDSLLSALQTGSGGGNSGGSTDPVSYSIQSSLSHCSLSNPAASVQAGGAYSALLTAAEGYTLGSVAVTMGGADVTAAAYNSAAGAISIASVTGAVVITATATQDQQPQATYTPQALYTDYAATGARFSTGNVAIDFAAGDYVEALIDVTTCTQDAENILAIGKNGTDYIGSYNTAVAFLFYKRQQSGVDKILVRIKDVDSNVSVDKWVAPASLSAVLLRVDKDGVSIDGTLVSGITSAQIANLLGLGAYIIGARGSNLTTATYDHITVYRKD